MSRIESRESRHPRPRVVLSRCLEMSACRYDGGGIESGVVRALEPFVEYVPVCPEVRIGLGVPRAPIRVERAPVGVRLVQPSTGRDLTERMVGFGESFADVTAGVDGLLLKSRSPSCGLGDVKVYDGESLASRAGTGVFAATMRGRYPNAAMEDEERLTDAEIRHHWLTRVFANARLRAAVETGVRGEGRDRGGRGALEEFHRRHKLVLMAYSPATQKSLGRLIAGAGGGAGAKAAAPDEVATLVAEYRELMAGAMAEPAAPGAHLNALQHAQGYFKDVLGAAEKRRFRALLSEYVEGGVRLEAVLSVLSGWAERFDEPYLRGQLYLEPYPPELGLSE